MAKVIGIDLGTSNSVAAHIERGKPTVIPNAEGGRLTPSVVAVTEDGRRLVGQLAKSRSGANPEDTVASIKRQMGSDSRLRLGGRELTPQEISSFILSKVKTDAEDYLGEPVEKAVISVPAYFNDSQRQATKDAGTIAGLDVIRMINEPTAAALAYGLNNQNIHHILVWDVGGGTFDVSILELGKGMFDVKAVSGDTWLGGDDWDQRIADFLAGELLRRVGVDVRDNRPALQRLKDIGEKAKIELSSSQMAYIRVPFASNSCNDQYLDVGLSRREFTGLTQDLVGKMISPTRQALADARLEPKDIDRVILVGGATRMPAVRKLCRELLGKEPYTDIDPDEVVAIGAAIQAGILVGELEKVTLLDVTPLSLGIETKGGIFARIIERNAKVPTSAGQVFSTAVDNQPEVDIHALQGEREVACHNVSLGRFQLTDIPLAPRGEPMIEVVFSIDSDGILHVSATDLHTGNESGLRIQSSRLSSQEIERMIEEAKAYANEDRLRREDIETLIKADNLIRAAEEMIDRTAVRLHDRQIAKTKAKVSAVKGAVASEDSELIRLRTRELQEAVEGLYEGQKEATASRAT